MYILVIKDKTRPLSKASVTCDLFFAKDNLRTQPNVGWYKLRN